MTAENGESLTPGDLPEFESQSGPVGINDALERGCVEDQPQHVLRGKLLRLAFSTVVLQRLCPRFTGLNSSGADKSI